MPHRFKNCSLLIRHIFAEYRKTISVQKEGGIKLSYQGDASTKLIKIETLYSVHYFECLKNFSFHESSHDCCGFLYVEKGEIEIISEKNHPFLREGEILFHKPARLLNLRAVRDIMPHLVIITFDCCSPEMDDFRDHIFRITERERTLMNNIIFETRKAFSSPPDDPCISDRHVDENDSEDVVQVIRRNLEMLLLQISLQLHAAPSSTLLCSLRQADNDILYAHVLKYLEANLNQKLTVDQICHETLIGRSQLQKLFHERNHCGVMDYFSRMKINAAKELISENRLNFTQISNYLGYASIHYFSRQFKKTTGMTPSEYSSSVKLLSNNPHDTFIPS